MQGRHRQPTRESVRRSRGVETERGRQEADDRRQARHRDGYESDAAGVEHGVDLVLAALELPVGVVDEQNAVRHRDANDHEHAHERGDRESLSCAESSASTIPMSDTGTAKSIANGSRIDLNCVAMIMKTTITARPRAVPRPANVVRISSI